MTELVSPLETHVAAVSAGDADPAQVCRTCRHNTNRLFDVSLAELGEAKRQGIDPATLACQPVEFRGMSKILADGNMLKADEDAHAIALRRINTDAGMTEQTYLRPQRSTVALVESCGQDLLDICRGCARLVRDTVRVPGGVGANGRVWTKEVVIGGYCSIPAEGIEVNGKVVFCDPKPRRFAVIADQSCYTCGNLMTFGNNWQLDHGTVMQVDLTPYQMHRATQGVEPDERGLAIWKARHDLGKALAPMTPASPARSLAPIGVLRFWPATVIDTRIGIRIKTVSVPAEQRSRLVDELGSRVINAMVQIRRRKVIEAFQVRFSSGITAWLTASESDPRLGVVHRLADPTRVAVELLSPYHRRYALMEPTRRSVRNYQSVGSIPLLPGWVEFIRSRVEVDRYGSQFTITETVRYPRPVETLSHSNEWPDCGDCHPVTGPCYYHAKAPRLVETEDGTDIVFRRPPGMVLSQAQDHDSRILTVTDGQVLDALGSPPHLAVFRQRWAELLRRAKTAEDAAVIRRQFHAAERSLPMGRPQWLMLNWGRLLNVEPWKPYCSANLDNPNIGIDLREAMGDYFGDPRSAQHTNPVHPSSHRVGEAYFSWAKHDALLDWQRVTNPGERVQEEMAENLWRLRRGQEGADERNTEPWVIDEQDYIEIYDTLNSLEGGSGTGITVAEWRAMNPADPDRPFPEFWLAPGYTPKDRSAQSFEAWWNGTEEVPYELENGTWVTRELSRRWLIGGYEFFKGKNRPTGEDRPEAMTMRYDPDRAGDADAELKALAGYYCSVCGEYYSPDDIDLSNPHCRREAAFRIGEHWTTIDPGTPPTRFANGAPNPDAAYFRAEEIRLCGAPLQWFEARPEWRQGPYRAGATDADDPYRRSAPVLAGGPDSSRWQTDARLLQLGHDCAHWRPKFGRGGRQRKVDERAVARAQADPAADLIGKWLTVQIDGQRITRRIVATVQHPREVRTSYSTILDPGGVAGVEYFGDHPPSEDDTIHVATPLVQALLAGSGENPLTYHVAGKREPVHATIIGLNIVRDDAGVIM